MVARSGRPMYHQVYQRCPENGFCFPDRTRTASQYSRPEFPEPEIRARNPEFSGPNPEFFLWTKGKIPALYVL